MVRQKKSCVECDSVMVFKPKVLHFKVKDTLLKHKEKRKVLKNHQFSFCGQLAEQIRIFEEFSGTLCTLWS